MKEGQYVALISLDVMAAFDAAWWPGILFSLRTLKCPRNLYNLCVSYFNRMTAALILNSRKEQRSISKVLPAKIGFWTRFVEHPG